jgi:hypothetical protein
MGQQNSGANCGQLLAPRRACGKRAGSRRIASCSRCPAYNVIVCCCGLCLQAVTAALRERETALLTLQSIEEDLERRRGAVVALEESGARRSVASG